MSLPSPDPDPGEVDLQFFPYFGYSTGFQGVFLGYPHRILVVLAAGLEVIHRRGEIFFRQVDGSLTGLSGTEVGGRGKGRGVVIPRGTRNRC